MQPSDLPELAARYWESAALNAAVQLNFFAALERHEGRIEDAILSEGWSAAHATALAEALTAMGLLEAQPHGWRVPEALQGALSPDHADSMMPVLRFNADLYALWGGLADTIRSGQPPVPDNPHLGDDPERTRRFVLGMHSRARLYADALAQAVPLEGTSRLLDVGGGPGTFAAALLTAHADLHAVVMDLPPVVVVAEALHVDDPVSSRLSFVGGDYHRDPLPTGLDTLLYCGALHQETEAAVTELVQRFYDVLPSGGRVVIVDLMLQPGRSGPAFSALFGVNMLLMRPTARMWAVDEVESVLTKAGFSGAGTAAVPGTPYQMVHAVRP